MEPDNDRFVIGCGYTVFAIMIVTLVGLVIALLPR